MKKRVVLLLSLFIVASLAATVFAVNKFNDLTGEKEKYAEAANVITDLKVGGVSVMSGYPDGTFKPENNITRAELAEKGVLFMGETADLYTDVSGDNWALPYIAKLKQLEIMLGYDDGSFKPDNQITLEELLETVCKALGYSAEKGAYTDLAEELGLLNGIEDVVIGNSSRVAKKNMAMILFNALCTKVNGEEYTLIEKVFPDYECYDGVSRIGIVDRISTTEKEILLNNYSYELDTTGFDAEKGDLVEYEQTIDGNKVIIKKVISLAVLDDAHIRQPLEDDEDEGDEYIKTDKGNLSLESNDADYKKHENYDVYSVSISVDKDTSLMSPKDVEKLEAEGHQGAKEAKVYDRIVILEDSKVILVFSKFDKDTITSDGYIISEFENGFYVMTSNGLINKAQGGYELTLVGEDGEEKVFETIKNPTIIGDLSSGDVYSKDVPTFVWVELAKEVGKISTIIELRDGLSSSTEEKYTLKNTIVAIDEGASLHWANTSWWVYTTVGDVGASRDAKVLEATVDKEGNKVVGFTVKARTGCDYYKDIKLPAGSFVDYTIGANGVKYGSYVFIVGETYENKQVGLIDAISYTEEKVTIDGQEYDLYMGDGFGIEKAGDLVSYGLNSFGNMAKIFSIIETSDIDKAHVRQPLTQDEEDLDYIKTNKGNISLDPEDANYKKHEEYPVYKIDISVENETKNIIIDSCTRTACVGHSGANKIASRDYDRILILEEEEVILVFSPFEKGDTTMGGTIVNFDLNISTPTNVPIPEPTRIVAMNFSAGKQLLVKYAALKEISEENEQNVFSDLVGEDEKYALAVKVVTDLGIMSGKADGTFGVNNFMDRDGVAKAVTYLMGYKDEELKLYDDVEFKHWAFLWILKANELKLMFGFPNNTFKPEEFANYEDVTRVACVALEQECESGETWFELADRLGLLENCDEIKANDEADRGNTVIILYNALKLRGDDSIIGTETDTFEIIAKAGSNGSISPESAKVEAGKDVTFKITPNSGYEISKLLVDGKSVGKKSTYTFVDVEADHTIEAEFAKKSSSTSGGGGGGGGSSSSSKTETQKLTPTPTLTPTSAVIPTTIPSSTTETEVAPTPISSVVGSTNGSNSRPSDSFIDVSSSDWFANSVDYVVETGLFKGTDENTFSPYEKMTRAMLVTVLYRMAGEPAVEDVSTRFVDVIPGEYYEKPVAWATKNGIVNGITETEFGTNNNITREQLVTLLYRYAKFMGMDVSVGENTNILSYVDAFSIEEYAIGPMQWAVGAGIVGGREDGTLAPKDTASRAEVAAVVMRLFTYST